MSARGRPERRPKGGAPRGQQERRPKGGPPRGLGGEQVEGRQAVRALLAAGRRRARDVWLAQGLQPSPAVEEILHLAGEAGVAVRRVPRARLDAEARSAAPQGVLAHAQPLPEADLDALARPVGGSPPFLLVVDGVTDPQNLGGLLRSAEATGVSGVVLSRHRSVHVTPAVAKAAAGAVEWLAMAVVPGLPAALSRLRERGVWLVGLDERGPEALFGLALAAEPVALVVGAEGTGLSRLVRQRCDVVAGIPMGGHVASLNVAAATSVALFEVARRRAG